MGRMNRNETPKAPAERLARHDVLEGVIRALDTLHEWRMSED
jgi:hypothetical protein